MTAGESGEDQKSHIEKEKYEKVPARRPGKDEDMAGAVLFVNEPIPERSDCCG